jgi:hypothetical protein
MKTKMKTILSVCMLASLLYACTKSDKGPLDCSGIENGVAALDDCGTCQQSYIYNLATNTPTYVDDTAGIYLAANEMLILAGSAADIASNPAWNASCTDCNDIVNGIAALDTCGTCHSSYMYAPPGGVTLVATLADTAGLEGMFILAGSPLDIANNPSWNNCK